MKPEFWVLVTKYLSNEASEKNISNLFALLESDKKYQKVLDKTIVKWNAVQKVETEKFNSDLRKEALLTKINTKKKKKDFLPNSSYLQFLKVAAILILVLMTYLFANTLVDPNWKTFKTAQNETLKIVLPDSTVVWLNKNTSIAYNFSNKNKRLLNLNGEAFFKVKRNEQKPFIIHSPDFTTQVLGTSFNINCNENEEASVSVITGKVAVSIPENNHVMLLEHGNKVIYNTLENKLSKTKIRDIENDMAWLNKSFVFTDETFEIVLKYLSKNYSTNFIIENKNLKNCLITANFNNESLINILTIICASLDCQFQKTENNTIIISGNGCEKKPEIFVVPPAKNQ